jgi:hypothetical protein
MKSYRYIPGDRPVPVADSTYLVLLSIELSFPNRPIPETAFSGNEVHLDRLLEMGWLEVIS